MPQDITLLSVDQLGYCYGARHAVKAVTFNVGAGEVLGLLGPNGAGKTTTISCIAGLLANWSGSMQFSGREFRPSVRGEDRKKLGYIPQELAIYPNLTARENLAFFGKLLGLSKSDLEDSISRNLALSGLEDRQHELVSTFSGGMQRRLNLAAGLLHSPKLVLLDEPTVGVDPQSRNHLFDTLLELKATGMSLLYTTHYMEEAQRLCDRIAIMNEGNLIAVGTPQQLAVSVDQPDANLETVFLHLTGRSLRDD